MTSKLKAIGRNVATGAYFIHFYYELPEGGRDVKFPTFDIPARDFDHMQETVRAFNKIT